MCGRFTHRLSWAEIHRLYRLTLDPFIGRNDRPARFNICPTQNVPLFTMTKMETRLLKRRAGAALCRRCRHRRSCFAVAP